MDVPYISSGAISKSHYALVRRVESAESPQQADQHLMAAVQEARHRLAHPALSLARRFYYCDIRKADRSILETM
jgi:AP-4 complex subunit epsilon-1